MPGSVASDTTLWRGGRRERSLEMVTTLILGVTFLWCLVRASRFAWYAMFTGFAFYDDEGYVLQPFPEPLRQVRTRLTEIRALGADGAVIDRQLVDRPPGG